MYWSSIVLNGKGPIDNINRMSKRYFLLWVFTSYISIVYYIYNCQEEEEEEEEEEDNFK